MEWGILVTEFDPLCGEDEDVTKVMLGWWTGASGDISWVLHIYYHLSIIFILYKENNHNIYF